MKLLVHRSWRKKDEKLARWMKKEARSRRESTKSHFTAAVIVIFLGPNNQCPGKAFAVHKESCFKIVFRIIVVSSHPVLLVSFLYLHFV